ncbi:hypothetical protein [Azorhizobium doebereinerae]|uniref:hypothetical protein n=1 Tax=Azorhizobium doebereinerae TaxID=281091 RepID=UPI0003FDFCA2|nr:hypothetical protein [Azorhizobium doebereinerae]
MLHCTPAPQGVIEHKGEEDDPAAIVTKALDTFKGEVIIRLDKMEAKVGYAEALTSCLDKMEARLNWPDTGDGTAEATEECKAFTRVDRTSMTVEVEMTAEAIPSGARRLAVRGAFEMVAVGANGQLAPVQFPSASPKDQSS